MSEEIETRVIMLSPSSHITPDQLTRMIHTIGKNVTVKETCYGCLVEGPSETVREIRDKVRSLDSNGIFSKIRAYPCGDQRRCRAKHGTRPGYAQLEMEWKALQYIKIGLDLLDKGEKPKEATQKKQLSIEKFKNICEVN